MKLFNITLSHIIKLRPTFNYRKSITNKRRMYFIDSEFLFFKIEIQIHKKNKK